MTTVLLNGMPGERFVIDTAEPEHSWCLTISHGDIRKRWSTLMESALVRGHHVSRSGGAFETRPYAIADLQLGPIDFQDVVGYRVVSKGSYSGSDDDIIGTSFLRMFTVGLNFADGRIDLVPNALGRKAMGLP